MDDPNIQPNIRKNRRQFLTGILLSAVAITVILYLQLWDRGFLFGMQTQDLIILIALVIAVAASISSAYQYLQGRTIYRSTDQTLKEKEMLRMNPVGFSKSIFNKNLSIEAINNEALPELNDEENEDISVEFDDDELIQKLRALLSGNATSELLHSINDRYSEVLLKEFFWKKFSSDISEISERILEEVFALSRRSNINLIIGSASTMIAAISLLYIAFGSSAVSNLNGDIVHLLSYYIPRLSVVIFIEVFAFFFLRLYKSGLMDIKYYQNELTNVDFKVAALKAAFFRGQEEAMSKLIDEFAKTERNFILKKGESTVELENTKIEKKSFHDALETVQSILKSKS